MRNQGGDAVVVAEAKFVGGNGVVLVHDGHAAQFHQAQQRLSGMEVLATVDEVVRHQQHLCSHQTVPIK